MALTYLQITQRAIDGAFVDRVTAAVVTCARDIAAEDPATGEHALRGDLAVKVFLDPVAWARRFAYGLALQTMADDDPSDAALFSAASALWNWYAGVVTVAP